LLIENVDRLPEPTEAALYFIAQEALNNSLKHSGATSVTVKLSGDRRRIQLDVTDNGRGIDRAASADRGGLGLTSMRERAERLGGTLAIESAPGQGTHLSVALSWQEEAR
jgi:signal transduction histidine kinase